MGALQDVTEGETELAARCCARVSLRAVVSMWMGWEWDELADASSSTGGETAVDDEAAPSFCKLYQSSSIFRSKGKQKRVLTRIITKKRTGINNLLIVSLVKNNSNTNNNKKTYSGDSSLFRVSCSGDCSSGSCRRGRVLPSCNTL